jgi:hypothetical protein
MRTQVFPDQLVHEPAHTITTCRALRSANGSLLAQGQAATHADNGGSRYEKCLDIALTHLISGSVMKTNRLATPAREEA